jgi:hypothetical protein
MDCPSEWRAIEVSVGCLERRIETENRRRHLGVAVKRGPMQRHRLMLTSRVNGPAAFQHEPHHGALVVPSGVRHLTAITF